MVTVTEAEARLRTAREILADLTTERATFDRRAAELADERERISFDAFQGDRVAKKRLTEIHAEAARQASESASVEAAIAEARRRVAAAEADHRAAEDDVRARAALRLLGEFRERAAAVDAAARELLASYAAFKDCYAELRRLGITGPGPETVRVACRNAVIAALMPSDIALHRDPPAFLAPDQRHSFDELCAGWANGIERWAASRLAAPETTEEAA